MSHINESCHVWTHHVTYMNKSYHISMPYGIGITRLIHVFPMPRGFLNNIYIYMYICIYIYIYLIQSAFKGLSIRHSDYISVNQEAARHCEYMDTSRVHGYVTCTWRSHVTCKRVMSNMHQPCHIRMMRVEVYLKGMLRITVMLFRKTKVSERRK